MNGNNRNFYGKYRGIITDNHDPQMLGRVRAKVSDVLGDKESGWAMPCVPYAGKDLFLIPPVNASVWFEFEHGDPDYPIWTGCYWATGEVPANPAVPETKVLKTCFCTITMSDTPEAEGVTIETMAGMKIVINQKGIEIKNDQGGSIKLSGPGVSINNGAFEVT